MKEIENNIDVKTIVELARNMRNAIELLPKSTLGIEMGYFPRGACGDAALLLGAYFVDCGFFGFKYVCGERGSHSDNSWTTHAWLSFEGLIVDITSDQFEDISDRVIVSKNSEWHQEFFNVVITESSDFRLWTGIGTHHLYQIYAKLKPILGISN